MELPLGSRGKQALSSPRLHCSTRYIIRISPPSYSTVCTQSKQLRLFFMLGKALESLSCYSAPTWYGCVRRKMGSAGTFALTLLAEISRALLCLTATGGTTFTAYTRRGNCRFESSAWPNDTARTGIAITRAAGTAKGSWSGKCLRRVCPTAAWTGCLCAQWISQGLFFELSGRMFCESDVEAGGERKQARAHKEVAAASSGRGWEAGTGMLGKVELSGLAVSPPSFLHTPRGASVLGEAVS